MYKNIIYEKILYKNNISESDLFNMISFLPYNNYSDIYFQDCVSEYWFLENGKIKDIIYNNINGVGIRVISGEKTIFSYTNEISLKSIYKCIKKINNIYLNNFYKKKSNILFCSCINSFYKINKLFFNPFNKKNKNDLLLYLYNYIKKMDSRINYISLKLFHSYEIILILSNDDVFIGDIRPLINFAIKIQVEQNNIREIGYSSGGGRYSYDDFLVKKYNNISIMKYLAKESLRIAINNLKAIVPKSGKMPIILGSGCPGILFHEAIGHGLEGDFIRKGFSIYSNLLNKKVASELCTIVDDATIYEARGSINIDDEGTLTKKNILIKNGILVSFMLDKLNSKLMNLKSTGNARRESYADLPIPRMTNTYLLHGNDKLSDIIDSIDYGLYIINLSGGQVDIVSGKFVFTVLEGYLIKNSKIFSPIKGITLIGSGIEIMNKISMVSNDLRLDLGGGICGKDGQNIPVGVGQPSLKIDSMIVGGLS